MTQLGKYSYSNAKIRAMLSFLLRPEQWDQMSKTEDADGFIAALSHTVYGKILEQAGRAITEDDMLERVLSEYDIALFRKVVQSLVSKEEKELVFMILERYEIEQLKVVLRIWHKKAAVNLGDFIIAEKIRYDIKYSQIAAAQNFEEIILLLEDTPYRKSLIMAREKYKSSGSLFSVEVLLDRDYYERLMKTVDSLSVADRRAAGMILGAEIDIENINWLIKASTYYSMGAGEAAEWILPGGSKMKRETIQRLYQTEGLEGIITVVAGAHYPQLKDMMEENALFLENFLYQALDKQVRRVLAGFPFSIGVVLGYLILKRRETKNLISLFYAKKQNVRY